MSHFSNVSATKDIACIVIIGYVWPEPNSSAAGSRMMQLLHYFKQRSHRVIFASVAQLSEHREILADSDIEEHSISLNCSSFDHWIKQLQPDIVLFDRFMMEEQFGWRVEQQCPDCMRILDTEDLHSLREVRQQQLKHALKNNLEIDLQYNHSQSLYQQMNTLDSCQREIAAIFRCDLSLMISSFEIDLLRKYFNLPAQLLLHLPFMLEPRQQQPTPFTQRQHFVTIGNFRHAPNWDSTLWLKQSIWPKIRKLMPSAQLHIYGAYPAKKVTDLHNPKQGFYIRGWAESAIDVLSSARICLSPLRFGAGIKGKFTDAMLAATPIITTGVGAEAMSKNYPWPGQIANDSDDIAMAAVHLYQSSLQWHQAASNGAAIIQNCYNKQQLTERLGAAIDALRANLAAARSDNFVGQMLRHHQHKSTKYMAQWIEAKNQNSQPRP
ncbi:MAG: glycosyltransferase family 4 protein [Pseudomonadales bacterium]|nr:glycosyltransferase family 4 protein [Pseudomonadales bacterium]